MLGHATDTPTTRRVPVEEAAKILGITANAVRKRIERGTLRSEREGDTRYVLLTTDMPRHAVNMPPSMPGGQILMVERLESEVAFLRDLLRGRDEELRREREAREEAERRHDTIIMRMAERIPELEAQPEIRGVREESVGKAETAKFRESSSSYEKDSRKSWWWRLFSA